MFDNHSEEENIVGYILLETKEYNYKQGLINLKEDWGIDLKESSDKITFTFINNMQVIITYVNEVTSHDLKGINTEVNKYAAKIIIHISNVSDPIKGHLLFSKLTASFLKLDNAITVYTGINFISKEEYISNLVDIDSILPTDLWVKVKTFKSNDENSLVTEGMNQFNLIDFEIINSKKEVSELYSMLTALINYTITNNCIFTDCDTVELTKDIKITLKMSYGIHIDRPSFKLLV